MAIQPCRSYGPQKSPGNSRCYKHVAPTALPKSRKNLRCYEKYIEEIAFHPPNSHIPVVSTLNLLSLSHGKSTRSLSERKVPSGRKTGLPSPPLRGRWYPLQ